jgi:hypothetical protein
MCDRTDGSIAYFTKTKYGVDTLELILYPIGGIGNATVTFFVSDANNTPISGALVHASLGGQSGLTNGVGVKTFTNMVNDTYAKYTVSKTGWSSAEANYQVYDGEYIHVVLYPVTPTVTPTGTPTPGGNVTPGWEGLFDILAMYGISFSMFKLILAGILMLVMGGMLGFYTHSSEGPLVGAGIGFIISVGLGLLELWIALIAIVVFGIIYGRKIIGSGG